MILLLLLLLPLSCYAKSNPLCDIKVSIDYELQDWINTAWLKSSLKIWHISIGSRHMLTESSAAIVSYEDGKGVIVPRSWYDVEDNDGVGDIDDVVAFALCRHTFLSEKTRDENAVVPVINLESILELAKGPFTMCMRSERIYSANSLTPSSSRRKRGYAIARGCTMLECPFEGELEGQPVSVGVSMSRAGIWIDGDLYDLLKAEKRCAQLTIFPSLKINVCPGRYIYRANDQFKVESVYKLTDTNVDVIIGIDPLLENNDRLVFNFDNTTDTTSFGIALAGSSFWTADPIRAAISLIIALIALNWPMIPVDAMSYSMTAWHELQVANVVSTIFMVMSSTYFMFDDVIESMVVMSGLDDGPSAVIVFMLFIAIVFHAGCIIHAQLTMDTVSVKRISIVSLFYSALICETIILLSCGATDYDMPALYAVASSMVWSFVVTTRAFEAQKYMYPIHLVSLVMVVPAVIASIYPSQLLLGVRTPWMASMTVFWAALLGGILQSIRPYYEETISKFY